MMIDCGSKIIRIDYSLLDEYFSLKKILGLDEVNSDKKIIDNKLDSCLDSDILGELINFYRMPRYRINDRYLQNTKELAKFSGNKILSRTIYNYQYVLDPKETSIHIHNIYKIIEFRLTLKNIRSNKLELKNKKKEQSYIVRESSHKSSYLNNAQLLNVQIGNKINKEKILNVIFDVHSQFENSELYLINKESLEILNYYMYNDTISIPLITQHSNINPQKMNILDIYIIYEKYRNEKKN